MIQLFLSPIDDSDDAGMTHCGTARIFAIGRCRF
jgi:hypothetical protein